MFADSQSTLYVVLSIAVALLTVFLCVTLIYLILILRDTNKIIEKVKDTTEKINAFVIKPISMASSVMEHVRPLIEAALHSRLEKGRKKKKGS